MVLGSVIAGAAGGGLANVALSPLSGGAGMIQSYWYGAGLILGERDMYTFHWEKIKTRLEKGEDYLSVLESEMNPAITAIANYSLQIMQKTGRIYMQGGIDFMAKLIENLFKLLAGEKIDMINVGSSGTSSQTGNAQSETVENVGGTQININGEVFIKAGSQQAKDVGATKFERLRETASQKSFEKAQEKTNIEINEIINTPVTKRRATGQQVAERQRLLRQIAEYGSELAKAQRANAAGSNNQAILEKWRKKINAAQIAMSLLLTKYQFN